MRRHRVHLTARLATRTQWALARVPGVVIAHMLRSGLSIAHHAKRFVAHAAAFAALITVPLAAQDSGKARVDTVTSSRVKHDAAHIKLNASTLLGIPGVAYERALTDRTSFNLDVTASLWRSLRGAPFEFLTVIPEWQIHSRPNRLGWYAGVHLGASIFRLQKWNYWGSTRYQEGYSTLLGGTVGYKRALNRTLVLDAYLGGGSQHGRYRGYDRVTREQYTGIGRMDESREWLPYRAGVMVGYRLN